jgi:glucan biosynthesis protein C
MGHDYRARLHIPPVPSTMASQRLIFLDHLRIAALGLLIAYHVGMAYVPWPWHVKAAVTSAALEPWMQLLNPWRMSLLFAISGAVTGLALPQAKPGWLRARLWRLGAPLLAGMWLIVPPQAWWQVQAQFGYDGSLAAFMGLYLRGYGGFCDAAGQCLALPTWNHLWFLPYLMAYTWGLWALLRRWPATLERTGAWLGQRLGAVCLLGVPWAILAALRLLLRPWFDVTHDLLHDPLAHAQYLPAFLAGAVWARTPGLWAALDRYSGLALALCLLAWGLSVGWADQGPIALVRAGYALQQWCGLLAALGLGHRWLNTPHPRLQALSGLVFPVYVLHQTLLIGLLVALRPLHLPPLIEATAVLLGTLLGALALAEAACRVRWLAPWLGATPR